ncbi:sulfotransferase [Chitinophaga agri]|uniref:Sulfotransferase family protein n=1 Tax=Chitinophaga agri TaxID=2703787 RepID=A0A6B9Z9R7_9BACT|nr:sulfotransferase [Chitinophaga agri]QHS58609.1 hypothetical protein GWR21_03050 [Chitinophaga agri]
MNNNVLVITGMHRSGTSLLTHWLNKCGLHVGDQLLPPGIGNVDGHYEDLDFYTYHEKVLLEHGLSADGLVPAHPGPLTGHQRTTLKALVSRKSSAQSQWGWKDPRTCLFLPFYREILPEARYLAIVRDYKTVVSSLVQRMFQLHDWKYEQCDIFTRVIWRYFRKPFRKEQLLRKYCNEHLAVWITYNEAILKHIEQLPDSNYIVVDHPKLKNSSQEIYKHLSDEWQFDLEYYDFKQLYNENRISDKLNIVDYIQDPKLLERAAEIHCRLQAKAI